MNFLIRSIPVLILLFLLFITGCVQDRSDPGQARIQPHAENPHYLAWGETPVFLLGATGYHSWTPISRPETMDFEAQLDRLADVIEEIDSPNVRGFVRALPYDPMNHMHDGPVDRVLQPWVRLEDGRYNLERFAPEWEERMHGFLSAALRRGIVVSLELWDDWSVTRGPGGRYDPGAGAAWNAHPFNPKNNVNYSSHVLPETTAVCSAPFYSSVPTRGHIEPVLNLQKLYVERVLDIVGDYPHVLVNISNESRAHLDWSRFWAEYVRDGVSDQMLIGEMPSTSRETDDGQCEPGFSPQTLAGDSRYDFVDAAQAVSGHSFDSFREQALGGGRRIRRYREAMVSAGTPKPVIVSKDYGRTSNGGNMVLWSRFAGGAAAARFHRLGADHGEEVIDFQHAAVKRLGQFLAEVPFWRLQPTPGLIADLPEGIGANVLAEPGQEVVIQLVGDAEGNSLTLEISAGQWQVRWLDPATGRTIERFDRRTDETDVILDIPGDLNHRIVHLRRADTFN